MKKEEESSTGRNQGRMQELQEKFRSLEPEITDPRVKQAFSVMNGMLQEIWRNFANASVGSERGGIKFSDIASMYKNAPKMSGPAINTPLAEGTKAPDFSLKDADGKDVKLSDYRGSTVLLVFYPLDWSPGCSQQLDLYQHEHDEFVKRGLNILAISVDSIYSHGAWAAVRNLSFPLLSDFNPKADTAKRYHVYRDQDGFSERALFIVDGDGLIRYSFVSPFLNHVPDVYELYRKLDEIKKTVTA